MVTWLESHQSLRDHPKKDHLAELLFNGTTPNDVADYAAAGVLHYLWYWALDFARDGDLAKFSDRQIAKGCRWQGDPQLLMQALTAAGFVDSDRHIHDWDEYAGRLLERRERDRLRVKDWRANATKRGRNADGTHVVQGDLPTYKQKNARGRADKSAVPPSRAKNCKCGAEMTTNGDGSDALHCPVCESAL